MMDKNERKTEPFRMACLMEIAAKVAKQMTTGVWHLTFEEMEVVLAMIQREIKESKGKCDEPAQTSKEG